MEFVVRWIQHYANFLGVAGACWQVETKETGSGTTADIDLDYYRTLVGVVSTEPLSQSPL